MTLYTHPETFGLREVGQVDWPGADAFGFDMTIVWQQQHTGYLYMASDRGCSCPSPFEDISGIGDLTPIDRMQTLIDDLDGTLKNLDDWNSAESIEQARGEVGELVQKVRQAWQERPQELAEHWDAWWKDARRMAAQGHVPGGAGLLMALCPDGHMRNLLHLFPAAPKESA